MADDAGGETGRAAVAAAREAAAGEAEEMAPAPWSCCEGSRCEALCEMASSFIFRIASAMSLAPSRALRVHVLSACSVAPADAAGAWLDAAGAWLDAAGALSWACLCMRRWSDPARIVLLQPTVA